MHGVVFHFKKIKWKCIPICTPKKNVISLLMKTIITFEKQLGFRHWRCYWPLFIFIRKWSQKYSIKYNSIMTVNECAIFLLDIQPGTCNAVPVVKTQHRVDVPNHSKWLRMHKNCRQLSSAAQQPIYHTVHLTHAIYYTNISRDVTIFFSIVRSVRTWNWMVANDEMWLCFAMFW